MYCKSNEIEKNMDSEISGEKKKILFYISSIGNENQMHRRSF